MDVSCGDSAGRKKTPSADTQVVDGPALSSEEDALPNLSVATYPHMAGQKAMWPNRRVVPDMIVAPKHTIIGGFSAILDRLDCKW